MCAHFVSSPDTPAGWPGTGRERHAPFQLHVSCGAPRAGGAGEDSLPCVHSGRKIMDPQVCASEGKPSLSFSIEEILKKPSARIAQSTETKNRSNYSEKPPALKAGSPLDFGKYQL